MVSGQNQSSAIQVGSVQHLEQIEPANAVIAAIRRTLGEGRLPLHEPELGSLERDEVLECLKSTFVSSVSPHVERFESLLRDFTGAGHVVCVASGTAALHLSLLAAGVCRDDEVLMPALSFVATANAATYCGAIPHFVESCWTDLGIDPAALDDYLADITVRSGEISINKHTGRPIRAMTPMHVFGHPSQLFELAEVAKKYRLSLVEDAAESLGSLLNGTHTGLFGLCGALSFNGNKVATTGGGGAILTSDGKLAARVRHLATTAKVPHPYEYVHDEVGFNYRMPGLNAALGCAQIQRVPLLVEKKRRLFESYRKSFASADGIRVLAEPPGSRSNFWLQAIVLDAKIADSRDSILQQTNEGGIQTRPVWRLLSKLKPFLECPRMDLPVAESIERRLINIPSNSFPSE